MILSLNSIMQSGFDFDVANYIGATGITNVAQQDAIIKLTRDLKDNLLWDKFVAIYPFAGSTATTQRINLKSAGTYDITFSGGWTHNATGAVSNGTNAVGNTFINPSLVSLMGLNSTHISCRSATNVASAGAIMGAATTVPNASIDLIPRGTTNLISSRINTATIVQYTNTTSIGYFVTSRTLSNLTNPYKDAVSFGNNTAVSSGKPNSNIFIGCRSVNGAAGNYRVATINFSTIGSGLTSGEVTTLTNIVTTFSTSLGR
jgi:hypothetical protein